MSCRPTVRARLRDVIISTYQKTCPSDEAYSAFGQYDFNPETRHSFSFIQMIIVDVLNSYLVYVICTEMPSIYMKGEH